MWRRGDCAEDNSQLLTLVHGVDLKGRPVIKAYTGNARHPVYQEYQGVINKNYEKVAKLAEISRKVESPSYGMSSHSYSESCSPSTPGTRASTTRLTPSLSAGARSPTIVPELKGMRAMISRLRCSLAIHAGLGPTNNAVNFLPVIPVRVRKPPSSVCPNKGCPKVKSALNKQDLESDSGKNYRTSQNNSLSLTSNIERCKGSNLEAFSQITKTKKRKKKKASRARKLKPKLKPVSDIVPLNSISSKYLLS